MWYDSLPNSEIQPGNRQRSETSPDSTSRSLLGWPRIHTRQPRQRLTGGRFIHESCFLFGKIETANYIQLPTTKSQSWLPVSLFGVVWVLGVLKHLRMKSSKNNIQFFNALIKYCLSLMKIQVPADSGYLQEDKSFQIGFPTLLFPLTLIKMKLWIPKLK